MFRRRYAIRLLAKLKDSGTKNALIGV